jgi:hypothetical protein
MGRLEEQGFEIVPDVIMWKVAVILVISFAPIAISSQEQGTAREGQRETQQSSPGNAVTTNQSSTNYKQTSEAKTDGWRKFVTWPEGIVTWAIILTLGAIIWQAIETRRAANASERAVIATLRPKLHVKHVWLIPGKLTDVKGNKTLERDTQWRVGCTIANVGESAARVIDSSLTIGRLGMGTIEGLLPAMPPYDPKYQFGNFVIEPGERQEKIITLGANEETMHLRLVHSVAEHRSEKGLPSSTTTPVVCFGFFRYKDNNGVARVTGFGWSWNANDMSFTRLNNPNYEYTD